MGISLHVWSLCEIRVKLCKWKWVRISCPGVGCPWGLKTGFWHFSMIQDISCCIDINVHGQMERILKIDCAPKFRVNINKEHPPTPNTSLIRTCNNPYYCSVSFESDILSSWEKKKGTFPSLWDSNYRGMVCSRKWSQACWEPQSWVARSAETPPEKRLSEKSAFLLIDSLLLLFL